MDLLIAGSDVLFIKSIEKYFCSINYVFFNLLKKHVYKYGQKNISPRVVCFFCDNIQIYNLIKKQYD